MTREEIAEIRARADNADKGPWGVLQADWLVDTDSENCVVFIGPADSDPVAAMVVTSAFAKDDVLMANTEFAAAARTDVPALCDDLTAALDKIDALVIATDALARIMNHMDDTGELPPAELYDEAATALADLGENG